EPAEPRLPLSERRLVLLGTKPRADRRAGNVEASVVAQRRGMTEDSAGLWDRARKEDLELFVREPVEVLVPRQLIGRRKRQFVAFEVRVERSGRGTGIDIDHRGDHFGDAIGGRVSGGARSAVDGKRDGRTCRGYRVAYRV